ncbi:hypothetical protein GH714_012412 [Hevea brasiliensis]|uniref:Disease resistance protein At4g27190-like leucine-rich repeats domain-containing protein n=1 Tax=Hevea brasiliensis TaxID=3981 RepID=A0A6A6KN33_HEVBR|nr:hypothetical protein GH714_012412 [Hevea brasiliensis]
MSPAKSHVSFDFPLLKRLNLYGCPNMKTFCCAISSSWAFSRSVDHTNNGFDGKHAHNSIVRGLLKGGREQKYVSSKEVSLVKNEEDPSVSHIDEKTETCYAFPSKLIEGFQNLENLKMEKSDTLEVIFSFDGLILQEYHATIGILNSLKELHLNVDKITHPLQENFEKDREWPTIRRRFKQCDQLYLKEDESDFEKAGAEELLQVLQDSQLRAEEKSGFCICNVGLSSLDIYFN